MLISTGIGEIPMEVAAATPTGMMISAVAVLLINWPSTAVSTKIPASRIIGLPPAAMATSPSAINCAAPVCTMAVESGIIAATRITVVQSTAR